jgi:hypothetical protein
MDWKNLANRAKEQIDKRGGTEGLKRDATKVKDIARGPGSLSDKAKQAADALKQPTGAETTPEAAPTEGTAATTPEAAPTEETAATTPGAAPTEGGSGEPAETEPTEAQRSK